MSRLDGFLSLSEDVNKLKLQSEDQEEGPILPALPELELSMSDEELIELKKKWEKNWEGAQAELSKIETENENYWIGKQYDSGTEGERTLMDNLIFESIATLLPIASRQNPEPIVCEAGQMTTGGEGTVSNKVQKRLKYLADTLTLKLKNKKLLLYWMLYRRGVAKLAWSEVNNDISYQILRPQKLILDPDATIDENGVYTGEYIGEARKETAAKLVLRFPKKKTWISGSVSEKMASKIGYTEWWTDDYVFWTCGNEVLAKIKNPHWNYDSEQKSVDAMGMETMVPVKGKNHFPAPQKPYVFLSIFNLGKHPWDETGLIDQNLSNQDSINKRKRQIDKNADQTNGGIAIDSTYFSKEEAAAAARAKRDGGVIMTPGNPNNIITNLVAPPLPNFVYQDLQDSRAVMLGNFGVRGSTPQGTKSEDTVRGKILTKGQDESRITGITEYLEQFMDRVYNYMVQLMYVYYDDIHAAASMGPDGQPLPGAVSNTEFVSKLLVSVKEGSTIPQDDLTKANQAIDLWAAGAIDPITLFERLGFPNPTDQAKRLVMFKMNPASIFPDLMAQQQMQMMQAQGAQGGGAPPGGGDAPGQQALPSSTQPQAPQDNLNQVPIR